VTRERVQPKVSTRAAALKATPIPAAVGERAAIATAAPQKILGYYRFSKVQARWKPHCRMMNLPAHDP
jgi:hypothetical protein